MHFKFILDGGSGWQVLCPHSFYKKHDIVVYSGIYPLTEGITFIWFWYLMVEVDDKYCVHTQFCKKHDIVVYSGIYPLTEGITFIWFWYLMVEVDDKVLCPHSIYKKHDIVVYSGIHPLTEGITFNMILICIACCYFYL
jgi:hypothetical protein